MSWGAAKRKENRTKYIWYVAGRKHNINMKPLAKLIKAY
jgi:hypothetical protein